MNADTASAARARTRRGWEGQPPLDTPLPLFVYGTLRTGKRNQWRLTPGETRREEATVDGFDLLDSGWGFPYAIPGAGQVCGEVVFHAADEAWREALALCDRLEGFRPGDPDGSVYVRRAVNVTCASGEIRQVWMYVADARFVEGERVEGGDWVAWENAS